MISGGEVVFGAAAGAFKRPPRLTVSQWSEAHRILPRETTREHGPWRNRVVPFAVEIMDALGPQDPSEIVALMKGSQLAGSELGINAIGYWIEHDPSAVLVVCPAIEDARKFSRRRIDPLIRSTAAVRSRVREAKSRDAGNTALYKEFLGGALILVGANAPSGLAGNPVRRIFFDEADRAPGEAGEEGDPFYLALVRTTTFRNRKVYVNSSPTVEGESRIEAIYKRSDQRRYYVPCPHCGAMDFLTWSGYARFNDLEDGGHFRVSYESGAPATAHLVCPACAATIDEGAKYGMLAGGEWRPTAQGDGQTRGYHLSSLYSPPGWLSWAQMAEEFERSKNDPVQLRTWVNTRLGETWRRYQDQLKPHRLLARAEAYDAELPTGVGILVAACDVQDYGLVYGVLGYGADEESWWVEFAEIPGDPAKPDVWMALDRIRERRWSHASGRQLLIDGLVVDSGGHHTEDVYDFCKPRYSHRVFAIRGGSDQAAELVGKSSRKNRAGVRLWTLGVDSGKDTIASRLKIETPGPGCIHFPKPDPKSGRWTWANPEFAAQLTSEISQRKRDRRRGWTREWKKIRDRNEAWDLSVYALAALRLRGPAIAAELKSRAEALARPLKPGEDPGAPPARAPGVPARPPDFPRRSWVKNW